MSHKTIVFHTKRILFFSIVVALLAISTSNRVVNAQDNLTPLPSVNYPNQYPASVNGFHVIDFRTENLVAPQGVDARFPRFSWKLFSQDLNEKQGAYQITITKPYDNEKLVWDSGKVDSDEQLYVKYAGEPLEPATEYMVELNVWNQKGDRKSQIYAPFSTGLFPTDSDPSPWKGKWIGLSSKTPAPEAADISKGAWIAFAPEKSLPVGTSVYRKTFEITDLNAIEKAVANFSVDNRGVVYLNGVDFGGSDNYSRAATRDVTSALREGKNVLAIRADNVGGSPNPGGVLGSFYVQSKTGEKTEYPTNESWKCIEGFDDSYVTLDFDDSDWKESSVVSNFGDAPWNEVVVAPLETPSPARYLANTYAMKKDLDVKRAVVYVSGLGYNECYLNGIKLGEQVCGPMYTDYDKSVPYNVYDATDIFKASKKANVDNIAVSVVLGNGRYYALRMDKCVHYGEPCLLFQMEVEYADGTKELLVSDESWKGSENGPISENNDYDGEVADGRNAVLVKAPIDEFLKEKGTSPLYVETRFGKTFTVDVPYDVDVVEGPKGKLVAHFSRTFKKLTGLSANEYRNQL